MSLGTRTISSICGENGEFRERERQIQGKERVQVSRKTDSGRGRVRSGSCNETQRNRMMLGRNDDSP